MKNNKLKGFTIVELVIVIAVIAILAGVLIPTFTGIIKKANKSKEIEDVKNTYTEYIVNNNITSVNDYFILVNNGNFYPVFDNQLITDTSAISKYYPRFSVYSINDSLEDDKYEITINDITYKFNSDNNVLYTKGNITIYGLVKEVVNDPELEEISELYSVYKNTRSTLPFNHTTLVVKTKQYYFVIVNDVLCSEYCEISAVSDCFNLGGYSVKITSDPHMLFSHGTSFSIEVTFYEAVYESPNNVTTVDNYKGVVTLNAKGQSSLFSSKNGTTNIIFDDESNEYWDLAKVDKSLDSQERIKTYYNEYETGKYEYYILSEYHIQANENASYYFTNLPNLETIEFYNFDTSITTNMSYMFSECYKLETIIGLFHFDTSNVTNMSYMFYKCNNINNLDVSSFNVTNCTNFNYMFAYTTNLNCLFYNYNDFIINNTHEGIFVSNTTYEVDNKHITKK